MSNFVGNYAVFVLSSATALAIACYGFSLLIGKDK